MLKNHIDLTFRYHSSTFVNITFVNIRLSVAQFTFTTRPSVRVHWVALWYVQRSRQIVTGPWADYGLAKTKQKVIKKPCNKLLTNRASSSRTGEYWPWVVSVRTLLRSVRTATTSGQYFPGSTALALG